MLNDRLVLMFTNVNGSRYININFIFRRIFTYFLLSVFGTIAFFIIAISVFTSEINALKSQRQQIDLEFDKMQKINTRLEHKSNQRYEELGLIGNRFEDIEGIIGDEIFTPDNADNDGVDNALLSRIDTTSITGLQKAFTMRLLPNGLPLDFYHRISNGYGLRIHPILKIRHIHTGIDYSTPLKTPIYATADGVVDFAKQDYNGGYGYLVKLSHSFGFKTFYAHLSKIKVKRGDFVKKGQIIAYSGNTGISTGPHLHYEVRFLGRPVDPINFIKWTMKDFNSIFKTERIISWQSLLTTINNLMAPTQAERPSSPSIQVSKVP